LGPVGDDIQGPLNLKSVRDLADFFCLALLLRYHLLQKLLIEIAVYGSEEKEKKSFFSLFILESYFS
jgi:hypothetical protein